VNSKQGIVPSKHVLANLFHRNKLVSGVPLFDHLRLTCYHLFWHAFIHWSPHWV